MYYHKDSVVLVTASFLTSSVLLCNRTLLRQCRKSIPQRHWSPVEDQRGVSNRSLLPRGRVHSTEIMRYRSSVTYAYLKHAMRGTATSAMPAKSIWNHAQVEAFGTQ